VCVCNIYIYITYIYIYICILYTQYTLPPLHLRECLHLPEIQYLKNLDSFTGTSFGLISLLKNSINSFKYHTNCQLSGGSRPRTASMILQIISEVHNSLSLSFSGKQSPSRNKEMHTMPRKITMKLITIIQKP
jgi:hypothetical protein